VSVKKSTDGPIRIGNITAPENIDGERMTVTALFADIKGSMDLMEDIDPEEARAIVDPALKRMIDAAQHYGGYLVQSTGDGIFALFGAPVAYEDHPQRALFAALWLQDQLKRYSDTLRGQGRVPLQARVGLNTGEVVVRSLETSEGHAETAPIGHAISLAARMQTLAPVGSIAATEATRKLGEGYFTFKSLGPAVVKGVSEPVSVFEVTGLGPLRTRLQRAAAHGYTRFVGREREMDTMKHAAELAKTEHGQIVAAVAEAGVGKSRLFHEFRARNQSGWMVLEAISFSHGRATAYLPLIELLHDYFGIELNDEARRRREKVAGRVAMLDPSLEDALPYLFALLSIDEGEDPLAQMDAQIRRRRTQEAVKRILLRESLNQRLMMVFEDLHWIDAETQAFLELLAEGIANAPVLLLVNYRPEYTHQWGSKTYYTQLRLDPLGKESAAEMLSARIGDSPDLAPLKRLVLERTEGNPLFIEELVEALFDEGVLVRNGAVKVTRPLSQLKIPPTVQGILAARIDRLLPEGKELLQTLAVIGSEFPLALVRQVVQLPAQRFEQLLDGLQSGEFIYEQPASGDIEYRFKHALTHDEAYRSLLSERRTNCCTRVLHKRSKPSTMSGWRITTPILPITIPRAATPQRQSSTCAWRVNRRWIAARTCKGWRMLSQR
jgi:class 3 adenylate cyclase